MANPTINSLSLGKVTTISFGKDADIDVQTFPGSDSDGTITFDYGGSQRGITITGEFVPDSSPYDYTVVKAYIDAIEGIIDGDQAESVVFTSDQTGSKNVKLLSFNVVWNIPGNYANYTLRLVEGE